MDGADREQRERLETIEQELEEVKKRLGRIWQFVESTDIEMADAADRIKEHRSGRLNWRTPPRKPALNWPTSGGCWTAPTPSPPLPRRWVSF